MRYEMNSNINYEIGDPAGFDDVVFLADADGIGINFATQNAISCVSSFFKAEYTIIGYRHSSGFTPNIPLIPCLPFSIVFSEIGGNAKPILYFNHNLLEFHFQEQFLLTGSVEADRILHLRLDRSLRSFAAAFNFEWTSFDCGGCIGRLNSDCELVEMQDWKKYLLDLHSRIESDLEVSESGY